MTLAPFAPLNGTYAEPPAEPPREAPLAPLLPPALSPGVPTEQACYMGIATSTATPTLRDQLGLSHGVGVVVEMVDPNSPAELAGLQPHDVITQLNDQLVINVQQLSVLVRLQKPGSAIKLRVLRKGEPTECSVQLAERTLPVLDENRANPAIVLPRPGVGRSCSVITHTDGDDVITLVTRDDDRHLTVKDLQGTTLYDGPLNTADDEAKVPDPIREKLKRVLANTDRIKELMPSGN